MNAYRDAPNNCIFRERKQVYPICVNSNTSLLPPRNTDSVCLPCKRLPIICSSAPQIAPKVNVQLREEPSGSPAEHTVSEV